MHTNRTAVYVFVILSMVGSAARAQIPTTEVCNAAFSQGISDNWYLFTERQQFEAYQYRLCNAKFESYQAFQAAGATLGLDIPLAEGLIGLTGSFDQKSGQFKQAYEKLCTSTYFSASDHVRYQSYISQVSSALTQSWNKCQELHLQTYLQQKGVFLSVAPIGQTEQFVSRLQIKNEFTGNVTITALHPDQSVDCYRGGTKVMPGTTTINIRDFSLTCHKDPSAELAFTVETNFGQSNQVRVPAGNQRLAEVLGNIEEMRARFNERLAAEQTRVDQMLATRVKRCRVCYLFRGSDGGDQYGQCLGGPRDLCSPWSDTPDYANPMSIDTDNRPGWCNLYIKIECER
jgi:hypothetical protein